MFLATYVNWQHMRISNTCKLATHYTLATPNYTITKSKNIFSNQLKSNIFSDVTECNLFNYDNVKLVSLQN